MRLAAATGGEGAAPGAVIGGITAYVSASTFAQNWIEEKLDDDIESK